MGDFSLSLGTANNFTYVDVHPTGSNPSAVLWSAGGQFSVTIPFRMPATFPFDPGTPQPSGLAGTGNHLNFIEIQTDFTVDVRINSGDFTNILDQVLIVGVEYVLIIARDGNDDVTTTLEIAGSGNDVPQVNGSFNAPGTFIIKYIGRTLSGVQQRPFQGVIHDPILNNITGADLRDFQKNGTLTEPLDVEYTDVGTGSHHGEILNVSSLVNVDVWEGAAGGGPASITISEVVETGAKAGNKYVVQRHKTTGQGTLNITGSIVRDIITGDLEYQIEADDGFNTPLTNFEWTSFTTPAGDGAFNVDIPAIPTAKMWYFIHIRFVSDNAVSSITALRFGVGFKAEFGGQSQINNMTYYINNSDEVLNEYGSLFHGGNELIGGDGVGEWNPDADVRPINTYINRMVESLDMVVGVFETALWDQYIVAMYTDGQIMHDRRTARLISVGGDSEALIFDLGQTDATNNTTSYQEFFDRMGLMFTDSAARSDNRGAGEYTLLCAEIGSDQSGSIGDTTDDWNAIRRATEDYVATNDDAYMAATPWDYDPYVVDGFNVHYRPVDLREHAERFALTHLNILAVGANDGRGPVLQYVEADGQELNIHYDLNGHASLSMPSGSTTQYRVYQAADTLLATPLTYGTIPTTIAGNIVTLTIVETLVDMPRVTSFAEDYTDPANLVVGD